MEVSKASRCLVFALLSTLLTGSVTRAFAPLSFIQKTSQHHQQQIQGDTPTTILYVSPVGVIFGTSTGCTQEAAEQIAELFGTEAVDVEDIAGNLQDFINDHDALIVGTPTWNTGADTERSGTSWDNVYYSEIPNIKGLEGKRVAVFGLGDSLSYGDNYADAAGELHDVFQERGCQMLGYAAVDNTYQHKASKSQRGDHFCGLLLDDENQADLTEGRITKWVEQLRQEGILEADGTSAPPPAAKVVAAPVMKEEPVAVVSTPARVTPVDTGATALAAAPTKSAPATLTATNPLSTAEAMIARLEVENAELRRLLLNQKETETQEFTPHYNPVTGITMWTSPDGKSCFYTQAPSNLSP